MIRCLKPIKLRTILIPSWGALGFIFVFQEPLSLWSAERAARLPRANISSRVYSKMEFKPSKKEVDALKKGEKSGRGSEVKYPEPGLVAVVCYKQIPPFLTLIWRAEILDAD